MKFNSIIPEMYVSDYEKSLHFYTELLGFKIEYTRPTPKFVFLSYQGTQLMLQEQEDHWQTGPLEYPYGRGINYQIETDDIEKIIQSLNAHNYPILKGPKDSWYKEDELLHGCREIHIMDPDGYLLRFSQGIGTKADE